MILRLGITFSLRDCPHDERYKNVPRSVAVEPTATYIARELWSVWQEKLPLIVHWRYSGENTATSLYVQGLEPGRRAGLDFTFEDMIGEPCDCTAPFLLADELRRSRVTAEHELHVLLRIFDFQTVISMLLM